VPLAAAELCQVPGAIPMPPWRSDMRANGVPRGDRFVAVGSLFNVKAEQRQVTHARPPHAPRCRRPARADNGPERRQRGGRRLTHQYSILLRAKDLDRGVKRAMISDIHLSSSVPAPTCCPGAVLVPAMVVAIEKAQGAGIAYNRQ
jgi:hypothetical protein